MLLSVAALIGGLAVAMGAYADHGLRGTASEDQLRSVMTAVRYAQIHAVAAAAIGLALLAGAPRPRAAFLVAGWGFALGICLFSGGILSAVLLDRPGLTSLAPVGGVTLMLSWLALAVAGLLAARRG